MLDYINPTNQRFLQDLARINARQDRAQRQLASGLRIERPSDDPDQISLLLETRAELSRTTEIQSTLGNVKTEVDSAESALSSAVDLVERVQVLGTEGATDTQTADTRNSMAGEVADLLGELVRVANTNVEGRYVFSGNSDQTAPYSIDWTQTNPVSAYQGSAATRQVLTPSGDTFPVSHSADQIFDNADPASNVFQSVNALHTALLANDSTAIKTALANVGSALTYLNTELAFYGTVQNQVSDATNDASNLQTQLQTRVGQIEDADAAAAITDLQSANLQEQTALAARAQMPMKSLFDYLG